MAEIQLTRGLVALVDDADEEWLSAWKWYAAEMRPSRVYAARSEWLGGGKYRTIFMHRVILGLGRGEVGDHANRDSLDNRRANLRICTRGQNKANSGKQRAPTASKYKGVTWHNQACRWLANISAERRRHSLGLHDSEIEAARAYDEAARRFHGEFAALNFPEDR